MWTKFQCLQDPRQKNAHNLNKVRHFKKRPEFAIKN